MAAGRPPKYDPSFCDLIIELGKQGKTTAHYAAACGVCEDTINAWSKDPEKEEFSEAFRIAMNHAKIWWMDLGQQQAVEYPNQEQRARNPAMVKYFLSAAFKMVERHEVEHDLSGNSLAALVNEHRNKANSEDSNEG